MKKLKYILWAILLFLNSIPVYSQVTSYTARRFVKFTGAPSNPAEGDVYYNLTTHKAYYYNGTSFVDMSGGGGGVTNTAANTELAMSDGTNLIPSGVFVPSATRLRLGVAAHATPVDWTLSIGESGAGTNITGANGIIRPGNGTGTGGSGSILFQTASADGTGSTSNTMATRWSILSNGDLVGGTTYKVKFGLNSLSYSNGTGPLWTDFFTSSLQHDLTILSAPRTVTWPDKNGTVAMTSDITGGGTGTTNTLTKFTNGAAGTIGDTALSEASAGSLTTTAGTAFSVAATAPTAAASTTAGVNATLKASDATAGTTNAGAAAGGDVHITAGDAKQKTSGNGNGGNVFVQVGAKVSSGTNGFVLIGDNSATNQQGTPVQPLLQFSGIQNSTGGNAGLGISNDINLYFCRGSTACVSIQGNGGFIAGSSGHFAFSSSASSVTTAGALNAIDAVIARDTAGIIQVNGGDATTKGGVTIIADANGSKRTNTSSTELLTLSTSGTTTNTSGSLATANSDIEAIVARVTTTITTATDWSVAVTSGIASCTNAWVAIGTTTTAQTGLTAGTTVIFKPAAGLQCHVGTASTLTVTTTGTPGAGIIRLTPIVKTYTSPTS